MSLANEYREKVQAAFMPEADSVKVSDDLVALCFAKDLMAGDPATFKVGYTAENAARSALEVFPDIDAGKLRAALGINESQHVSAVDVWDREVAVEHLIAAELEQD